MSKSRKSNQLPESFKNNFDHTNNLHPWLNVILDDAFHLLFAAPSMEMVAVNMQTQFAQLLKYNASNTTDLLRQRSESQQNIFHFLFGLELNINKLIKAKKKRFDLDSDSFSASQPHHVFYREELKEKAKSMYPDKKELSVFYDEYQKIISPLIQEKVLFYFESLEKYYETQFLNLINAILDALSKHPETIVSMLLERDNHGNTPLHYLTTLIKNISPSLFNLMMKNIKNFPEDSKSRILFAADLNKQLFLHSLCHYFSPSLDVLCDVFGKAKIAAAFSKQDNNDRTPFHIACAYQHKSLDLLFHFINTCQSPSICQSILCSQDASSQTPLTYLVQNKHITDEDIRAILSKLDLNMFAFIIEKNITLQTSTKDTLLSLAIEHNRHSIINVISQHAHPRALLEALLKENESGQHALQIAYAKGTLDTYKLVASLYSSNHPAFFGILAASPFQKTPKHFSRHDARAFHTEFLNVTSIDIFRLAVILPALINPDNPSDNAALINEVTETCACIALHQPLQKSQGTGFTFFAVNRFPDLDNKITGVTSEHVDLYFNAALPAIKPYVSSKKQTYIDMILNQFHAKILKATSHLTSSISLSLHPFSPAIELQPLYDHDLESRWKNCIAKERELAERNNYISYKVVELREREKRLNPSVSFPSERTVTPSFMLTNALATSKVAQTNLARTIKPQVLDALECRRQECHAREVLLKQKEYSITQQETNLSGWENRLLKQEEDLNRQIVFSHYNHY